MREALKAQLPEGVDFEFEEINDDDYERILAEASKSADEHQAKQRQETETKKDEEPLEHIIDEL